MPPNELRAQIRRLVDVYGLDGASARLRVHRDSLLRILAALPVRPGTLLLAETYLPQIRAEIQQ